jgi:hypothetical protein
LKLEIFVLSTKSEGSIEKSKNCHLCDIMTKIGNNHSYGLSKNAGKGANEIEGFETRSM